MYSQSAQSPAQDRLAAGEQGSLEVTPWRGVAAGKPLASGVPLAAAPTPLAPQTNAALPALVAPRAQRAAQALGR